MPILNISIIFIILHFYYSPTGYLLPAIPEHNISCRNVEDILQSNDIFLNVVYVCVNAMYVKA